MSELMPPAELVREWETEWLREPASAARWKVNYIAARSAQWGADRELEECCRWLESRTMCGHLVEYLRTTRRPAPPSIKQQALAELETLQDDISAHGLGFSIKHGAIRKALEALPDD